MQHFKDKGMDHNTAFSPAKKYHSTAKVDL